MRAIVATIMALLCGSLLTFAPAAMADDDLKSGKLGFDALKGRTIVIPVTSDGKMSIRLGKDGVAKVKTKALPEFTAMWWVSPKGEVCLVAEPMWNGGRCYVGMTDASMHLKAFRESKGDQVIPIEVK